MRHWRQWLAGMAAVAAGALYLSHSAAALPQREGQATVHPPVAEDLLEIASSPNAAP